jgi:hypothetical protein
MDEVGNRSHAGVADDGAAGLGGMMFGRGLLRAIRHNLFTRQLVDELVYNERGDKVLLIKYLGGQQH